MQTQLRCRGWRQESLLRLLENVLTVGEDPKNLVVYAALGKAARDWKSHDAIVAALRTMEEGQTLVVQSGDPDDDHPPFEQRYSVSSDGQRLIEVIGFKGGRSGGFTISRVWDREAHTDVSGVPPGSTNSAVPGAHPSAQ